MRPATIARAGASALVLALLSCDGAGGPSGPDLGPMFDDVERYVWDHGYEAGDWEPDWDDAPFYGPAFYARAGWGWDRADYRARASEAVEASLARARAGLDDPSGQLVEDVSGIVYGTMGVIEAMDASGDMEPLETVDEVIDVVDGMLALLGDYAQGFDNYGIRTYGPTSITAVFMMVHLQYALYLDTPRRAERIARAEELAARVEELAWNGAFYQFEPSNEDELFLYPNVAMMIVHGRLAELTGDGAHLARAEALFDAIEPLRCPDRPGYRSPYSAEAMGAMTDDYSTLSSQAYTMFGLGVLAEQTGDPRYRERIDEVLSFVEGYLWVPGDGRIYHHWMDGRLAVPEDPEYYCIGCNLQVLYLLWWLDAHL